MIMLMMNIVLMIMLMMPIVLMIMLMMMPIVLMMPTFLKSHSITRPTKKLPCSDQFALPAMKISTFSMRLKNKSNQNN